MYFNITYRVSHKRRPIAKILKVDNLHYFTSLIIILGVMKYFIFLRNGRLFWETLYIMSHFPSMGSDDPPPYNPFLGPLKIKILR